MTKLIHLRRKVILFLLYFFFSISLFAQNNQKIYFSEFGFSLFTDYFSSDIVPFSMSYPFDEDKLGNPRYTEGRGHFRFSTFGFVSINYTPRFNLYEINSNKSISIESPITLAFGLGRKMGSISSVDSVRTTTEPKNKISYLRQSISLFTIAAPIFISYNYGLGSTYASDAERGFSAGIGLDNIHPLFWVSGADVFDKYNVVKKNNFYFLPAISLGYRKWTKEKATEINLKIGYWPSNEKNIREEFNQVGLTNGFSMRLSYNKLLNF